MYIFTVLHYMQESESKKKGGIKGYLKFILKLAITCLALYYISTKIDLKEVFEQIKQANIWWFIAGILAFHLSKLIASFRVLEFYKEIAVYLSIPDNIRLHYIGMFYNLFLPGSIGGDGYKIFLIKKNSDAKTRHLISAALLDRLSGLSILVLLGALLLLNSTFDPPEDWWKIVSVFIAIASVPAFYLVVRIFFKRFKGAFLKTTVLSVFVQLGQILCAYFVLRSLGIDSYYWDYFSLFMISSVVAVIPFTVAGVGARELVFMYGYQYLNIDSTKAIGFTLLFFLALAITSLTGILFTFGRDEFNTGKTEG